MPKLTIKDIAGMAGVSYATVSRVLNGERYVKPETYERVMEVCRRTGYTPNAVARQLKQGKSNSIGIIIPDISNVFFSEMTRNIEWEARQKGYNVFISSSFYDYGVEERNIQALLRSRVDGIVISGVGDRSPETIRQYAEHVPIVFIGDNIPDKGVSSVTVDNFKGVAMATEYLIKLGHPRLAFLGGRSSSIAHQRRHQGFLQALRRTTVPHEIYSVCDGSKIEDGYKTALRYFSERQGEARATAVLTISDHFALGVMQAAHELGIRIPRDLSLIGFDNISFAALPGVQLTSVSQPQQLMCEYTFRMLLQLIEGDKKIVQEKHMVEPTLVCRDTCLRYPYRPG